MRYDVAIVGSGPAAVSAALTLKLHNKSILWFGSRLLSPKVEKSEKIANYPGVAMVTGPELNRLFRLQAEELGLEITERRVTSILSTRRGFMLQGGDEIYDAKAVLLATGAVSAKGFDGEERLLGAGVSYCATCDGHLYKGRQIAVYCGSKEFEHEVVYLAELAEKVWLFTPYADCGVERKNVVRCTERLTKIRGEDRVSGVMTADGTELPVDGVFVLRNAVAPAALLRGLEMNGPDIAVNRSMETSKPGVYAAGDCTGRPYQLTKAVGEGNVAAHSILKFLAAKEGTQESI